MKLNTILALGLCTCLVLGGCTAPAPTPTASPTALPTQAATALLPTDAPAPASTATAIPIQAATTPPASPSPAPAATLEPPSSVKLVFGPYLQLVTPNSITIVWETDAPAPGAVSFGKTGALGSRQGDPLPAARHAITLAGLEAYTTYTYRVEAGSTPLSPAYTFRTAAGPSQDAFTFVAYGDTRSNDAVHQAVVDRIAALRPDFAVHVGDLLDDGTIFTYWKIFINISQKMMAQVPVYFTPGNHEANSDYYFDFFNLPGNERWYSFAYGNALFISLELDGYQYTVDPNGEQLRWLEQTLAANRLPWTIVYFHEPVYTASGDPAEGAAKKYVDLFEKYHVSLVLAGHIHNYQRRVENDVTYIITGGGGAPLYTLTANNKKGAAFTAEVHHLVLFKMNGKTLTGQAQTPDGKVFDEFTLTKP
jgi:acid phosphatase type 7